MPLKAAVLVALPVGLVGSLIALPLTAQATPSADAVISEVYGGGGNSGASLTHDFIELGNSGTGPFDLSGWSVQYLSGSPSSSTKWQVTPLTGNIPAGGTYLVQEAKGSGGDTALPTPDATGTIAVSATSGTVALVHSTTALTCLTAEDCAADGTIEDLAGFGTAVVRESAPATGAGNTTLSRATPGSTTPTTTRPTSHGPDQHTSGRRAVQLRVQGNAQTLDHILVSPAIKKPEYDVVHINAEFSDQSSDHDPQVVRFK
ncbi:lamin tail domain-containing protein [Streptomyces sp. FXJ1.4098]|nr:lamin tail domain-containing protein [Streptomyces sp. FXJ1.4098]